MQISNNPVPSFHSAASAMLRAGSDVLAMPFDVARENYVCAVRAGLIERSMLQSARFARALRTLESLMLGLWARQPYPPSRR